MLQTVNCYSQGFDCSPAQFTYNKQAITFVSKFDDGPKASTGKKFS